MKAATLPRQRPRDAKLLVVDAAGRLLHAERNRLADFFCPGDLLVANDAATLPASLAGLHLRSGDAVEVRLAGRRSMAAGDVHAFSAIVFGAGDHRTRTEDRAAPPALQDGDRLALGPLRATVTRTLGHPRLIELCLEGDADAVWAGIARHGRPIQYAHIPQPLALWDVWTSIASRPVAFEPPSAGFVLDWNLLRMLRERGVGFATLTHAAGLSSTGDAMLDARLPFDEPYHLPDTTVQAIARTQAAGGRIVALGTTVTRALEHGASLQRALSNGDGIADLRIGAHTRLRVIDAIVSGTHEIGTSHHELLRAFASQATLARADAALERHGYRTHEFGDSVLIERSASPRRCRAAPGKTYAAAPSLARTARTRAAGSTMRNTEPLPGSLCISISPPWRCTTCLTIARPSPVPPVSRERLPSTR
jgi:S-adenosylmethionine:tRNA ribosyltransferase-isomerase